MLLKKNKIVAHIFKEKTGENSPLVDIYHIAQHVHLKNYGVKKVVPSQSAYSLPQ